MKKKHAIVHQGQLWQTAHVWLKACGNKVNINYCKEEITTHPDYPSLISLIDFLDSGGMAYKALQADPSYIHEFNYPLIAHIKQPGDEHMHIMEDWTEWDKQKKITDNWSGIVIYPEKNAKWNNEQNRIYQRNSIKDKMIAIAFALTGITLFIISTFQQSNFSTVAFGFLSLTGLIISIAALGTELGFQSQIVKQVCSAVSEGGCEKVLKSRYAHGIAGITPADASVLYFTSQFIVYLFGSWYPSLLQSIFLFAFGGIAIATWSIYAQATKLKQWCALCLAIAAVLLLQSGIVFIMLPAMKSIFPESIFITLIIVLSLILLPVKQLIKTNSSNKLKLVELKKWKLDGDLFLNQWRQGEEVDTTIWQNDLLLGDIDAPLQITVACNPFCGPCAKAHAQLDNLLYRFAGRLKVQIRFLFPEKNSETRIVVRSILQKAATQSNADVQSMLADWFALVDFSKWSKKWQPDDSILVEQRLQQHSQWIRESNIVFTPTFFINGRKLPNRYSLNDIEVLIPQLVELLKEEVMK